MFYKNINYYHRTMKLIYAMVILRCTSGKTINHRLNSRNQHSKNYPSQKDVKQINLYKNQMHFSDRGTDFYQ